MSSEVDLPKKILELVESSSPLSVEALVTEVQEKLHISREDTIEYILELNNDGKLAFSPGSETVPENLTAYLYSAKAYWFWTIIFLSLATSLAVFYIPGDLYPHVIIRYLLGSLFVLLLPGYSLIKTLFPYRGINNIERTALSIGMSLALVPLVGLMLNYTPWGIRIVPIMLSLLLLTILLTIIGVVREHQEKLHALKIIV